MKQLTQHWRTSFIGFGLIGAGIGSVFTGKADWTGATIIITTGLGLLMAKDAHAKQEGDAGA